MNLFYEILKKVGYKKKETRIFKRLRSLWRYCELCNLETDKIHVLEKDKTTILFEFQSNLGAVHVRIEDYYNEFIRIEYSNYAGSTVFCVFANATGIPEVEPRLGEKVTVEEIDLALLELETYLLETFGDSDKLWEEHLSYEKYAEELHNEQVRLLM